MKYRNYKAALLYHKSVVTGMRLWDTMQTKQSRAVAVKVCDAAAVRALVCEANIWMNDFTMSLVLVSIVDHLKSFLMAKD